MDAVVVGESMDSGDKATNKAMAIAFKYACFQTFCIPTESLMDDPDATIPEQNGKNTKNAAKESPQKALMMQKNNCVKNCHKNLCGQGIHGRAYARLIRLTVQRNLHNYNLRTALTR